ncbi:hypothetical protein QMA60_10410 [Leuconostoc suionicum]|uniref:hypothetical protein n=1 Tax=Leuconostoc suionicum TaxID=1511761 RepID=UPI0024AD9A17|nr:hypothetical protein [Leuconostoc suionicum]MDI6498969.1 hypothetical protein [Leuconostoc suionicum]MDI6499943.1 hypothetical protein [Leuconostoc suionicum]MDI6503146.1 hypothetical protein [Leuconostoc suionicum]MDI6666021.1 hypothetical protein [Leuconostoc suionicum]
MGFEHILILIGEIGVATGVFYTLFNHLFKNAFNDSIATLKDSVDALSYNVSNQTKMLERSLEQIEDIEKDVQGHETRIQILEHERNDK